MGRRHEAPRLPSGNQVRIPRRPRRRRDRNMPVGSRSDPRRREEAHAARAAAERGQARGLRWPRSAKPSRRPACCSAQGARARPTAPDGPWRHSPKPTSIPTSSSVHFIARAITPPQRPRRYDTRFFTADASAIAERVEGMVGPDAELVELIWIPLDHQGARRAAGDHRDRAERPEGPDRSGLRPRSAGSVLPREGQEAGPGPVIGPGFP